MYRVEIASADGPQYSYVGSNLTVATESYDAAVKHHSEMDEQSVSFYGDCIRLQEFSDGKWDQPTTLQEWEWVEPSKLQPLMISPTALQFPPVTRLDFGITLEFLTDIRGGIREPIKVDSDWKIVDGQRRAIAAYILGMDVPYVMI